MAFRIKEQYWSEDLIINLKKEGVSSFDRLHITDYQLLDKKYLQIRLELSKTIKEEVEDAWQKER